MKVYKGTDKNMQCRGYQFVQGVEAAEDRAELCEAGFHACEAPLDVLGYYAPADSRYFEAELEGAATAGNFGAATAGNFGAATAGNFGAATAGDSGAATSRGKSATGKNGLSVVRGNGVIAKGGIGSVIVIAIENDDNYDLKEVKAGVIDGETLKPDTWYTLKDGEFVEVK